MYATILLTIFEDLHTPLEIVSVYATILLTIFEDLHTPLEIVSVYATILLTIFEDLHTPLEIVRNLLIRINSYIRHIKRVNLTIFTHVNFFQQWSTR